MSALPQYLDYPRDAAETFGTLSQIETADGRYWEIEGHPQAILTAKRLFPGADGRGRGKARFQLSRRLLGDLVWFLQRWPMRIPDRPAFDAAWRDAVDQEARRAASVAGALLPAAPPLTFSGTLAPFQSGGLAWALNNPRTLLADEMGLGKTVQAIAKLAARGTWPAAIVVPPHIMLQWRGQLERFLGAGPAGSLFGRGRLQLEVLQGYRARRLKPAQIYLLHYGMLAPWIGELRRLGLRQLVFDEVQELRHGETKKYSAASQLSAATEDVLGLSGTPIYNRGAEIWHVLNIIDFQCLGDWSAFTREWCIGFGSDIVEDPAMLGDYLRREGLLLRRRKEDVLTDLPPVREIVIDIDGSDTLFRQLSAEAVRLARQAVLAEDQLDRGRLEREAINAARRATGEAKIDDIAAFVEGLLEAGEPTLLFLHHHAVVDGVLARLAHRAPRCITGRQSPAEKAQAIRDFAEGAADLVIISLRAAAGIDGLQQRARVVVFGELDWSPAVHAQARDRAHRMGVRDSVLAYYLVSQFGTDPDMIDALGVKTSQFQGLMADAAPSEQDRMLAQTETAGHMARVLDRLRGRGAA